MEPLEVEKKSSISKKIRFVILVIIIIVLVAGILVYRNNKTFKLKVNNVLKKIPGPVGKHFSTETVGEDDVEKKSELASYYLALDSENAADKLYILKLENGQLYDGIIKMMNSLSPNKTEEILKIIRSMDLRKNSLASLYNAFKDEKKNELKDQITRLEGMETFLAVNEIEQRLEIDNEFAEDLPLIIGYMDEKKVSEILYYMEPTIREKILLQIDDNKRSKIDSFILKKEMEENKYADIASFYETQSIGNAIEEIGNTETYEIEELAKIYSNLSVVKSAEILSRINDDEFMEELFANIREEENLKRTKKPLTVQLNEAMQFVSEYNKKINELVSVYEKMSPDKVADIVETMMNNEKTVTSLKIDSKPVYEVSDATIIMDVLSKMKKPTLSKIMSNMDTGKSSILTQRLANPKNNTGRR